MPRRKERSLFVRQNALSQDFNTSDSWVILNPIEQSIKAKIEKIGTPLKDWDISIYRGILTGCNEVFIIDEAKRREILGNCKTADERKRTDELIRPILRGRDIKRYSYEWKGLYVILAYYGSHHFLAREYPTIHAHLKKFKNILENRGQCRYTSSGHPNPNAEYPGQHHWLELDNNPTLEKLDDFSKPKILWADISDKPKFALDTVGKFFCSNTVYFLSGSALEFMICYLNSPLSEYLFSKIGSSTGVGTRRWQSFTIERLLFPRITITQEKEFKQLLNLMNQSKATEAEINRRIYALCCLSKEEIAFIEQYVFSN